MATQTHPKALPTDLDFYAKRIKEKANPNVIVADKINKVKDDEINDTLKEVDRIRAQKLLQSVQQTSGLGTNPVLTKLFEGKSTEQITDMLNALTPEALDNLTKLASRFDNNPLNNQEWIKPERRSGGNDELVLTILKTLLEERSKPQPQQQGITLEGVAALISAINQGKPVQVPTQSGGMSPMEIIKMIMEFNRPVQEQLKSKDKELIDAKLREMEAKMPPDLADQIKYVKDMAPMLGLTGGQTNELDLKLEEMRQNREVDMKRLDWEQKKYEIEQENDSDKWDKITHLLEGPLGDVIKSFGNAGADRVRGSGAKATLSGKNMPKPVQTQCPNCGKPIYVDANADSAVCGNCGAILQRQGSAPPTQEPAVQPPKPEPTRVDASANKPEQVQPEEPEEEETEEENEEDEHTEEGTGTNTESK